MLRKFIGKLFARKSETLSSKVPISPPGLSLRTTAVFVILSGLTLSGYADTRPAVAIKAPQLGSGVSSSVNTGVLWGAMEASFTATRKFRVLSRDSNAIDAIREEQQFSQSDLAAGDAAFTGEISNANYLILPIIESYSLYRQHKPMPNFDDKWFQTDHGSLQVSAQMIDTTTGQIVTTFTMNDSFSTKRKIVNNKGGGPGSARFTQMSDNVAAQLADLFVDNVFPMKVVKRDRRNNIIINRGTDGGLKVNDLLEVFYAGEELVDPDTGESIGSSEEYVGRIQVTRINPKVTFAKIVREVDPANAPIAVGDIARRPQ